MDKIIVKENKGVIEIHFESDINFMDGFPSEANKLLEKGINLIAYSYEFDKLKKE